MRPTLEEYALLLAETAATRSEDPKRKVGAAILGDAGLVLALGYNGPPPGVDLTEDEWAHRAGAARLTVHAEANALRLVRPGDGRLLASTYCPCAECVKAIRSHGITRVIYKYPNTNPDEQHDSEIVARRLGVALEAR